MAKSKFPIELFPAEITLTKLETLPDAEIPQEHRFPSKTTIRKGLMWEHSLPKKGEPFFVMETKLIPNFHTSTVMKIKSVPNNSKQVILVTRNSKYLLEF